LNSNENTYTTEIQDFKIRYNWLKFMYAYTIIVSGFFGLLYIVSKPFYFILTGLPFEEPLIAGVTSSVFVAFAILSILGLRSPLKFSPTLLLQLTYKIIWFITIIIPLLIVNMLPSYAIPMMIIYAIFIIGDLIAIPFKYLFAK
jgi:hypothetical protein